MFELFLASRLRIDFVIDIAPEALKPFSLRNRSNSLNASTLLSMPEPENKGAVRSISSPLSSSTTNLLAPPPTNETNTGTLAVRAMKSVGSLARMKSWPTLSGTTINMKEGNKNILNSASTNTTATNSSDKTKEKGEEKKKKQKIRLFTILGAVSRRVLSVLLRVLSRRLVRSRGSRVFLDLGYLLPSVVPFETS